MVEPGRIQQEAKSARRAALTFSAMAVVLTAVLVWLLAGMLSKVGKGLETRKAVVAARMVSAFSELKAEDVKLVDWPAASLPDGALTSLESFADSPRVTLVDLAENDPLVSTKLSTPEQGVGLSQIVQPNTRAFVIEVNESIATARLVRPGAFVDVIATFKNVRTGDTVSKVVLQNVQVLAVGPRINVVDDTQQGSIIGNDERDEAAQKEQRRVITLAVAPDQVEPLVLATREGKLDIALRSGRDKEVVETTGVTVSRLVGDGEGDSKGKRVERTAPPPPRTRTPASPATPPGVAPGPAIYKVGGTK